MSYSSYQTQQDLANRVMRLEIMLVALIRNTQGGDNNLTREMLLSFAGVVDVEHNTEQALEEHKEVAHAVEDPK